MREKSLFSIDNKETMHSFAASLFVKGQKVRFYFSLHVFLLKKSLAKLLVFLFYCVPARPIPSNISSLSCRGVFWKHMKTHYISVNVYNKHSTNTHRLFVAAERTIL